MTAPNIASKVTYLGSPNGDGAWLILNAADGSTMEYGATTASGFVIAFPPVAYISPTGVKTLINTTSSGLGQTTAYTDALGNTLTDSTDGLGSETITTPGQHTYKQSTNSTTGVTTVTYPDKSTLSYSKNGVVDENGNQYVQWGYTGNQVTSIQSGVTNGTAIASYSLQYSNGSVLIKDPLGTQIAQNGNCLQGEGDNVRRPHLHFVAGDSPFGFVQIKFAPFGVPQLTRAHKQVPPDAIGFKRTDVDVNPIKNPFFTRGYGHFQTSLDTCLVEVAGIEPASDNLPSFDLHA